MRTNFSTLTFSLLTLKSYACLTPITAKISCRSETTYSLANCIVGSTIDVRVEITPTVFIESYSSIDVYIVGVPQQSPAGASINDSAPATSMGLTNVPVSQISISPYTYMASFNQFNPYLGASDEYVCVSPAQSLYIYFPGFILPYDI